MHYVVPRLSLSLLLLSLLASGSWARQGAGVPVSLDAGNQTVLAAAADGHGGVFTLWVNTSIRSSETPVFFVQHFSPGGARTWDKSGVQVAVPRQAQLVGVMAPDGQGGVLVGILDGNQDVNTVLFEVIVQRLSNSGKQLWGESGIDVTTEKRGALSLVPDGSGGAIVVFGSTSEVKNLAQHLSPDGSLLWPQPGILVAVNVGQTSPMAVSDGSGGAVITWPQYPDVSKGGIQRLSGDGSRLWGEDGIPLALHPENLAGDSGRGSFVSSFRSSSSGQDVLVQKFDASGAELWTPGGAIVSQAQGNKLAPRLAPDGAGGTFVSWAQVASGTFPNRLYAQHLNDAGSALWAMNGVPASPANVDAAWYGLAIDGTDGLFTAYEPLASDGTLGLAVHHLGSDGAATGAPVTQAQQVWEAPITANDDRGNAFLTWTQYHSYFYLEPATGLVTRLENAPGRGHGKLSPTLATEVRRTLDAIAPNPARGSFRASGMLSGDAPACAELIDLRGRVVASRILVPAGGAWSATFGESDHLASGNYVLRIIQGHAVSSAKVSVIR
jgi:hypothetical protein